MYTNCICLGVEYWEDLPADVLECYESLKFGFRNRFDLTASTSYCCSISSSRSHISQLVTS